MSNSNTQLRLIRYTHHEKDIHEFEFFEATRAAVDEWLDCLAILYENKVGASDVYMLLNTRNVGSPPLNYGLNRARSLLKGHAGAPVFHIAILHSGDTVMANLASTFINLTNVVKAPNHFLTDHSREHAIEWLLAQQQLKTHRS